MKKEEGIHEGLITEPFKNGMLRVGLHNKDLILGYVSGRIKQTFIRILGESKLKSVLMIVNQGPSNLSTRQQGFK